MKLEYQHGTIYLGDCFEILPSLEKNSAEICVTSPPCNLNKVHSGGGKAHLPNKFERYYERFYEDNVNEYIYQGQQKQSFTNFKEYANHQYITITVQDKRGTIETRYNLNQRHITHGLVKEFPIWVGDQDRLGYSNPRQTRFHCQDERIFQIGKPKYSTIQINILLFGE